MVKIIVRYPAWSFGPGSEKDDNLQERAWTKQKVQMLRSHQQQLQDIISHGIVYTETISHGNGQPPTIKTKEDPIPAIWAIALSLRIEEMIKKLDEDLMELGTFPEPEKTIPPLQQAQTKEQEQQAEQQPVLQKDELPRNNAQQAIGTDSKGYHEAGSPVSSSEVDKWAAIRRETRQNIANWPKNKKASPFKKCKAINTRYYMVIR